MKIAIAGGGIGGLTLAVALQHQGIDVTVFERQPEIRESGAGISLWPNALAALDAIDLGAAVRSVGRELASGGMRKIDGRTAATFSTRSFRAALGDALCCVDRGELVATLAAQLSPGTVITDARVVSYQSSAAGVRVLVEGDTSIDVDGLVGADGINSTVANQLAGPLRFSYSGYTAWRGIAQADFDPEGNALWACVDSGCEVGWLPLRGDRTYWFATASVPQGGGAPDGDETYLDQLFGNYPEPVPQLLVHTAAVDRIRNDIVDRERLAQWGHGPVTLLGDAAHPMRPHLGQGGCQAIEDAVLLSRYLGAASDPAEAFRRYEDRRRRRADRIVRLSRRASFTRPPSWRVAAFDRFSSLLSGRSIGPLLRVLAPIAGYDSGARAVQTNR